MRRRGDPCQSGYPWATPRLDSASMRAATIRDGEVVVAEHLTPSRGRGEVLVRVRAAGLNGRRHPPARGALPGAARIAAGHPGSKLAGEVAAREARGRALRRGRPRDGHRRRRRAGRAGHRARAPAHAHPRRPELRRGRRRAEVFTTAHDASSRRPACVRASACSCRAQPGGVGHGRRCSSARTAGAHVTASVRSADLRDEGWPASAPTR